MSRRDLESEMLPVFAGEDRRALGAALDDRGRGEIQETIHSAPTQQGLGLRGGGEQQVRRHRFDQGAGGPSAIGQERRDGCEIHADEGARFASERHRTPTGQTQGLTQQ